jgi:hypothetical protein
MTMPPRLRRFALTAHVTLSVGWLGAVVVYLALAVVGLTGRDAEGARLVLVPISLAALVSGLVQSLGTEWGLLRYYWVVTKLLLTVGATVVLVARAEDFFGALEATGPTSVVAAETARSGADAGALPIQLVVHAGGGLLVLLAATALSVYKPWGRTRYGRRKLLERREVSQPVPARRLATTGDTHTADHPSRPGPGDAGGGDERVPTPSIPRRAYVLLAIIGLALLLVGLHFAGGGLRLH